MITEGHPFGGRKDVAPPVGRLIRVSRNPAHIPSRPHSKPLHRWDDPQGEFRVLYAGQDVETCIPEVLATFRRSPEVDDLLASVTGVDDGYGQDQDEGLRVGEEPLISGVPPHSQAEALRDVLLELKVGQVHVRQDGDLADMSDPFLRAELGKDPRVRAAIEEFDALVGNPKGPVSQLDGALIRLAGKAGRRISQALSRAVYERGYLGISYISRWDDQKRCLAIFANVKVTAKEIEPLDPTNEDHRAAVAKAAALHDLALPAEWR